MSNANDRPIAIDVRDLVKSHGPLRVLDGVSLAVRKGEVAVVIGPSGGGKSTLLRCINALESFQSGTIRVADAELNADATKTLTGSALVPLRKRVGMVFQQFNLFPHMTVLDNVLVGPTKVLGQSREQAEPAALALLERVGMIAKRDARPGNLSGGQQQRVAIARALAVKPEAILFDEPTSALDPKMAGEVLGVVTDLAKEGQTMVVVTHAMDFARRVAHTVHLMIAGKIAESAPPAELFDHPREDVTRAFVRNQH